MKKIKELRELSAPELEVRHGELNSEIFELKCENSVQRKLEKPHLLKEKKRDRARVLTLLRVKQTAAN